MTQLDGVDCRSLHRGGNLESTADLTGTEGSNPAPSSGESANPRPSREIGQFRARVGATVVNEVIDAGAPEFPFPMRGWKTRWSGTSAARAAVPVPHEGLEGGQAERRDGGVLGSRSP